MQLDPLDCRILDLLDRDARSSCDEISRKLKISGDAVAYHIDKLSRNHVIEGWSTLIDLSSLGLTLFRISSRFTRNVPLTAVAERVFNLPFFTLLAETRGTHDLIAWGAAPTLADIQTALSSFQEQLGTSLRDSSLELITETAAYSRGYLVNKPGKVFAARGKARSVTLDEIEVKLLQRIKEDARKPATSIAAALGTTPNIVAYRNAKLERLGVISGYRVRLNSELAGVQRFRVQLEFRGNSATCREALQKFCEGSRPITRLEFQIGAWPAEIGLEVDSFSTLHTVLDGLRDIAGGKIQAMGVTLFRRTISAPKSQWDRLLGHHYR